MLAVFKRELKQYFVTPIGYVFLAIYLVVSGLYFSYYNIIQLEPDISNYLSSVTFIFLIIVPLLTMRLLAEERRTKTDQLLLTAPCSVGEMVTGKYLAACAVFGMAMLITFIYPLVLGIYGDVEYGQAFANYLVFFLIGICFLAIGVFISSVTENQIIAAVLTAGVLMFFWLLSMLSSILPTTRAASWVFLVIVAIVLTVIVWLTTKNWVVSLGTLAVSILIILLVWFINPMLFDSLIVKTCNLINVLNQQSDVSSGWLSLEPIVFCLSFSALFLFFTVQNIEKRRWS